MSQSTYFNTMAAALEFAYTDAFNRGYKILFQHTILSPVNYLTTERYVFDLEKDGKLQRKALVVVLYRMDSGKYELTHYIN